MDIEFAFEQESESSADAPEVAFAVIEVVQFALDIRYSEGDLLITFDAAEQSGACEFLLLSGNERPVPSVSHSDAVLAVIILD